MFNSLTQIIHPLTPNVRLSFLYIYDIISLLQHSTWVHIFESGKQDWFTVASILEDTLAAIKLQHPEVKEVFLRSDNAGCYHNGFLWSSIPGICERAGRKCYSK